jgi:hypothetical protein
MTSFSAPVAQLDRALPSEGRGREFESRRARQVFNELGEVLKSARRLGKHRVSKRKNFGTMRICVRPVGCVHRCHPATGPSHSTRPTPAPGHGINSTSARSIPPRSYRLTLTAPCQDAAAGTRRTRAESVASSLAAPLI